MVGNSVIPYTMLMKKTISMISMTVPVTHERVELNEMSTRKTIEKTIIQNIIPSFIDKNILYLSKSLPGTEKRGGSAKLF